MFPSIYTGVYENLPNYKLPTATDMTDSIEHPNLTSLEYRRQPIERTVKMHPVWERVAMNSNKEILIATNKSTGREWCSTTWAFPDVNQIEQKMAKFRLNVTSILTNIAYLSTNMVLGTFRNGGVQLWSTYSEVRSKNGKSSLFLIAKRFEHFKPVECLSTMGEKKAVTGGQDFTLKVWDMSEADMQSINTYRFAHLDTITGVAVSKGEYSVFATASRDKSVLLWDTRLILPAIGLFENHEVGFKDVCWDVSKPENSDNYIYIGDESGNINLIDKRIPKSLLWTEKFFNRPIRKIAINGDYMAIIANTNKVKIYSISLKEVVYENDDHQHFIRDCLWYDSTRLLTVGCDSKMLSHYVPALA